MNWGRVLLTGCLFILGIVQARVANFAMVYTSDSSWTARTMSINLAEPRTVRYLFQSQASPILLNGSLAKLVIQLFAAQQLPVVGPGVFEQSELDALRRAVSTCAIATIKAAQGPLDRRISQLMKQVDELTDENQKLTTLAKAMTLAREVLRYAPPTPCDDFRMASGLGSGGWAEFFQMIEAVRAHDWRFFLVVNSPQKMVLFVPQAYLTRVKAECGNCADAQAIGLRIDDARILKPFGSGRNDLVRLLAAIVPKYESGAYAVSLSVHSLFKPTVAHDLVDFNLYFDGHGLFDKRGQSQVGLYSQDGGAGVIAGIPAPEFLKMLTAFNDLPVKIVMWSTCFGGGKNARAAAQMLQISEMVRKQRAARDHLPYQERRFIAISAASTDLPTKVAARLDYGRFFNDARTIIQGGVENATNQQVSMAVRAIADEQPIILLPERTGVMAALNVAGVGRVAASVARRWQVGAQGPFGANDLVVDDSLVQASSGLIEVPATTKRVLVYSQDVDKPMHIAYDAAHPTDLEFVSLVPAGEKVKFQSLVYDGPVDQLFKMLFPVYSLARFAFSPSAARLGGASILTQFSIDTLRFPHSVLSSALGFPFELGGDIALHNVWFLQYPEKLAMRGWLIFTRQDVAGRVWLFSFEILPGDLFATREPLKSGVYERERRDITGDVAFQLKRAQESAIANALLQEAAANGEVDIVDAFVKLYQSHGRTRSSLRAVGSGPERGYKQRFADDPDQVIERRFEAMGMHTTAPNQFGIDAAYFDAALIEEAGALGVLARHATRQIKDKAIDFAASNLGFRDMALDRVLLLQLLAVLDQNALDNTFAHSWPVGNFGAMGVLACLVSSTQFNDAVFAKIIDKTPSRSTIGCALDSGRISQWAINDGFKKIVELAKYLPERAAIASWWQQRGGVDLSVLTTSISDVPAAVAELMFDNPQFTPQRAQKILAGITESVSPDSEMLQKLLASGKLNAEAINRALIKFVSGYNPPELIIRMMIERPEISATTIVQALIALPKAYGVSDQKRLRIAQMLLASTKLTPSTLAPVVKKWADKWLLGVTPAMRKALKARIDLVYVATSYQKKIQAAAQKKSDTVASLAKQLAAVNKKIKSFTVQLKKNQAELQKVGKQLGNAKRDLSKNQQTVKKAKTANKKKVQGVIKKFDAHIKQLQKKQKNLAAAIKKYTADLNKAKAQAKKLQAQIKKQQASEKKRKAAQKKLEAERLKKKKLAQVAAQKKRQAALKKAQAVQKKKVVKKQQAAKKKAAAKKVQKKPAKKGPAKNARKAGR